MYIKLTNEIPEVYSISQLRKDNPNVSFPANISDSVLAEWNIYPCKVNNPKSKSLLSWKLVNGSFEQVNGEWIVNREYIKLELSLAEDNVREKRNELLADCDWTQLADASVDSLTWANYRQALRDIPQQDGFPYNVAWPTKP